MTDPDRWHRLERLFHACADAGAADCERLLDEECAGDAALRTEVLRLLAAAVPSGAGGDSGTGSIRRAIDAALADHAAVDSASLVGRQLGPWRVVQRRGHGGMGAVYVAARDDDQFDKDVAIKVLRTGLGAPADLARFRRERRILATLEHPNIARLIDGGETTLDGTDLPFIVMELVDGETITEYCRTAALSRRARITLFLQVLDAVQYAHQHLVLHRDLKPTNILVTTSGLVKLLDFGVATLLDGEGLGADTRLSPSHAMTPEYASPEQVRGERLSAASDVYSLGKVLGELLTGFPLDRDLRAVLEKAQHEQAPQRYASVEQLADDLRRDLDGRTVLARPQTPVYRARRFASRYRWQVAAVVLVVLAIAGGAVATASQARRATARADELRKLAGSLIFQVHDSIAQLPGSTAARGVLVKTSVEALDRLSADTAADPNFLLDLAAAYERLALLQGGPAANVGDPASSAASYRHATEIYARLPASVAGREDVLRKASAAWVKYGSVLMNTGHLADAKPALARGVDLAEQAHRATGTSSIEMADALRYDGDLYINWGSPAEALQLYRRAVDAMEQVAARTPSTDMTRRLAVLAFRTGEAELDVGSVVEGCARVAGAIMRIETLAAADPGSPTYSRELAIMALRLANCSGDADHVNLGDPVTALAWNRRALAEFTRLAEQDSANARGQLDLALGHSALGSFLRVSDPPAAVREYAETFATLDRLPPATRDSTRNKVLRLRYERGFAAALANNGRVPEGITRLRRVLTGLDPFGADLTDDNGLTQLELARAERRRGDARAAWAALDASIADLDRVHATTLDVRKGLADALQLRESWLAQDPARCREAREPYERQIALWRELEAAPFSAETGRRERERVERRAPPACVAVTPVVRR